MAGLVLLAGGRRGAGCGRPSAWWRWPSPPGPGRSAVPERRRWRLTRRRRGHLAAAAAGAGGRRRAWPPGGPAAGRRAAPLPRGVRPGRGDRGRRGHVGRPLPAHPPGRRRAAGGRAPTWWASRWPPPPGAPAGRCSGRLSPRAALVVGGLLAGGGILLESRSAGGRGGRLRAGAGRRRGLAVLAPGHEPGHPPGHPGHQRRGRLHRRRVRGMGGRRPGRGMGVGHVGRRPGACSSWPPSPASWWWPHSSTGDGRRPGARPDGRFGRAAVHRAAAHPAMILPRIETPADLRTLDHDELAQLAAEIRAFIVETVTTTGGPPGLQPRRGRADPGPAPGLRLAPGRHPVGHRPPGLRAQAAHRPPLRLPQPAPGGRAVRLPEPGRVRARLDREQPRLDRPLLRPRAGHRLRAAGPGGRATAGTGGWWPWSATARSPGAWPTRRSTTSATPGAGWWWC